MTAIDHVHAVVCTSDFVGIGGDGIRDFEAIGPDGATCGPTGKGLGEGNFVSVRYGISCRATNDGISIGLGQGNGVFVCGFVPCIPTGDGLCPEAFFRGQAIRVCSSRCDFRTCQGDCIVIGCGFVGIATVDITELNGHSRFLRNGYGIFIGCAIIGIAASDFRNIGRIRIEVQVGETDFVLVGAAFVMDVAAGNSEVCVFIDIYIGKTDCIVLGQVIAGAAIERGVNRLYILSKHGSRKDVGRSLLGNNQGGIAHDYFIGLGSSGFCIATGQNGTICICCRRYQHFSTLLDDYLIT